jgi:hypothetical protein
MVIALIKKYWFILLFVIASIVYALLKICSVGKAPVELTPITDAIEEADTEAKVAKAESKAKAQADLEELERIKKIEDGKERRKRLVELLQRLDN